MLVKLPGNAFCAAIDLKIFTMNVLILEILHTASYYLFWMKLQGFGAHAFYKLSRAGEMISWMTFGFLSSRAPVCGFLPLLCASGLHEQLVKEAG